MTDPQADPPSLPPRRRRKWPAGQPTLPAEGAAVEAPDTGAREPGWRPAMVRPVAPPARLRRRHRGLLAGFVLLVLAPLLALGIYLYGFARDSYASTTGFTIRSDESQSAVELLGGLSALVGSGASSNNDVLYAFIHSQAIVERLQAQIDIRAHYSADWEQDPLFSIWPDATIEDLLWFWRRVVSVSYDKASGLTDVQVRARTPEMARRIAEAIVSESEAMINALNTQSRRDAMANAERDLDEALERLRTAREDMAAFRASTQIVDPQADVAGRMGVINGLQAQLAQALVDYDLLLQTNSDTDPRVRQAERRIEVIRDRIAEERRSFAREGGDAAADYPGLIARFESLAVNQEFAEQTYTAALTARDAARSVAERQSLYLATYVRPTLAESAEYPERVKLLALAALFLMMGWSALVLVYYSLRDRG